MALEEFRQKFGKVLMELIGTAALVMTIQLSVATSPDLGPIVIGLVLAVVVYAGGNISGGHYNPAVSLAVFLRGALSFQTMLLYWLFQVGGAFCGALLGALVGGTMAIPTKGPEFYFVQAFLAELVFTCLLCLVVLASTTHSKVEGNSFFGAAIGITVLVGSATCTHISGGVFNPAVAVSLSVVHGIAQLAYMLWIVVAELVGGLAGAALFYLVAPDEFAHFGEEARALLRHEGGGHHGRGHGGPPAEA